MPDLPLTPKRWLEMEEYFALPSLVLVIKGVIYVVVYRHSTARRLSL